MSVATDLNEYAREFNDDVSARDRIEIDRHANLQAEVCLEFMRMCDVHGITNVNPVPHIYTAHEEMSPKCLSVAIVSTLVGAALAILLTLRNAAEHSRLLVALSLGVFFFVQVAIEVAVAFVNRGFFARRFHWFFVPPAALGFLAASILLLARVASAGIAEAIIGLFSAALWSLEMSSLATAAVAVVGFNRFGWSGRLHRSYVALQHGIEIRKMAIERRTTSKNPSVLVQTAVVLLVLLGVAKTSLAQTPTVMLDRTGSIAEQVAIETRLTESLSTWATDTARFRLIIFSDHLFSAPVSEVETRRTTDESSLFTSFQQLQRSESERRIKSAMDRVLSVKLNTAACTSVPDIITRATLESTPILVVTDLVDDCARHEPLPMASGSQFFFVLVRSRFDSDSDGAGFRKKAALLHRVLPNATIYPEFRLNEAVKRIFVQGPSLTATNAVFSQ